jgi:hypothetical protein
MTTVSVQTQLTMEQLLEAMEQLDAASLESVKKTPGFRRRFDRLNVKRRAFKLTAEEHQELLRLIEEVQAFDVHYIEALAELAVLRQVSLPDLMAQLGITAQ